MRGLQEDGAVQERAPTERTNREGLTFAEFRYAAAPAEEVSHGKIRTRYRLTPQEISEHGFKIYQSVRLPDGRNVFDGPPAPRYVYGSKTRDPMNVLKRAWEKGEDPTEWRAWALEQQRQSA